MCNRHSFIVTRAAKVFHGMGLTHSHTSIREIAGLGENDSSTYAFEWQPPAGWPDADYYSGLTQDTAPIPAWEMKARHLKAIESHLRRRYPDMDAWNRPDCLPTVADLKAAGWTLAKDGDEIVCDGPSRIYITHGSVLIKGQTGGYCWASGNATLTSSGQTGGYCRAYDNATLTSSGQTGGYCRAYDNATLVRINR